MYKCKKCGSKFKTRKFLVKHQKDIHGVRLGSVKRTDEETDEPIVVSRQVVSKGAKEEASVRLMLEALFETAEDIEAAARSIANKLGLDM